MTLKGYQFLFWNSAVLEALALLETASLLCIFALRARPSVARLGPACRFLNGGLTLIALHFPPLTTDELEQLVLAPCPDGFLRAG